MSNTKNSKLLYRIVFVLDLVAITMIGLVRTVYMLDAFAFSMIPMILCMLVILFSKSTRLFSNKGYIIVDVVLTGLFLLMLSVRDVVKVLARMNGELFDTVFKIIYLPVLMISLMIIIDYAINKSLLFGNKESRNDVTSNSSDSSANKKFLGLYYPTWLIIAVSYPFAIGYYPGNLDNDFNMEWVMGGHPVWSDWHTVGFAFFVRLCTLIIRSPFMVTLVQSIIYYLVANYAIGKLNKNFPEHKKLGWIFAISFMIFGAAEMMSLNAIVKDNASVPFLFAFSIGIFDYLHNKSAKQSDFFIIGILGFLASIFRHAMIVVVIVTLIVVIIIKFIEYCSNKDKEELKRNAISLTVVATAIFCSYVMLTEVIAFKIVGAERNPAYISYTIPMNLAGSLAYRNSVSHLPIDDEIVEKMEQIIPMEKWAEYYCPFDADTLCRPWHEIGDRVEKLNDSSIQRDVIRIDLWYLTHYPVQCIFSYMDITSMVWQISNSPELIMYSPSEEYDVYSEHHLRKGEFFKSSEEIRMFLGRLAIGRSVIYRGGLYLFIIIMVLVILAIKRRFAEMTSLLPVILYACTLMLSIPQQLVRYVMIFQCCSVFFGIVAFVISSNGKEKI